MLNKERKDEEISNLFIGWKIKKFKTHELTIQLNFTEPIEISSWTKDFIRVEILQNIYFTSLKGD